MPQSSSAARRIGQYLGLVHAGEGQPLPGGPRRSRYGGPVLSPRLDQDLDALAERVAELERRLAQEPE